MVHRASALAAFAAFGLALYRLDALLLPTTEGAPWQVLVLIAAAAGILLTLAGLAGRASGITLLVINLAVALAYAVRIMTSSVTAVVFPNADGRTEIVGTLERTADLLRYGVSPVIPIPGLTALLAVVVWLLAALGVWALWRGRPLLAIIPPLVLHIQFATLDIEPAPWWGTTAFIAVAGAGLLAVATDERTRQAERMRPRVGWTSSPPFPLSAGGIAAFLLPIVAALATTSVAGGAVPTQGLATWRAAGGLGGDFYGSVSYNPFTDIRQRLVNETEAPVLTARLTGDVPNDRVYWRLLTLDSFDGSQFFADGLTPIDDGLELEGHRFAGRQQALVQDIAVAALRMEWLPSVYAPVAVEGNDDLVANLVAAGEGSLHIDGGFTYRGMQYRLTSLVPDPDLNTLARNQRGELSPTFAAAAAAEDLELPSSAPISVRPAPPNAAGYLGLPDTVAPEVRDLAVELTEGLETNYERGLALEAFLRDPDAGFAYTTDIDPGHAASELAAWLTDPASPNYRTGYCEQYATSLAVLARLAGVPSRVVLGFTPGELVGSGTDAIVVVRDSNAHAWVELWIPTLGWVRFDPTPRADGVNPATVESLPFDVSEYLAPIPAGSVIPPALPPEFPTGDGTIDDPGGNIGAARIPLWFFAATAGLLVLLVSVVPAWKLARRRRRLRHAADGDVAAAWDEIVDRLTDLGDGPLWSDTPLEFAAGRTGLATLAEAYNRSVYGAMPASVTEPWDRTVRAVTAGYPVVRRAASWWHPGSLAARRNQR
jgi:hypothetical protein